VETKPALQKILRGLLHIKEETRIRPKDSRKNKPFLSSYTSNQGIGKINGNNNAPIKRHRIANWIKKIRPNHMLLI
jgi:hypothetical protein